MKTNLMKTIDIRQYTKKKLLRYGNYCNVFTALDNKTNKILAAKIFKKVINESSDKTTLNNLKRELSIISRIQHPSIIKFIGLSMKDFDNNDRPVIITNYMPNGSLRNLLDLSEKSSAPKEFNDTKKLIIIYGIAESMQFLHFHQILHRNLNPDNILMDSSYYPILANIGISEDLNNDGIKDAHFYLSPEIWEEDLYLNASDVYAFSLIVYEIIANEKPFNNFENMSIYRFQRYIMNGNRPDTTYINEPYKHLIESCWAQDLNDRPTFDEIVRELRKNPDFITDSINEDEYRSYIEYIKTETKFKIKSEKEFDKDFSEFFYTKKNEKQVDELMLRIAELEKQISIDKEVIKEFKKEKKALQNQIQELKEEKHNIEQNELLKDRSLSININKIKKENAELPINLEKLVYENQQLKNDNQQLKNDNQQLKNDNQQLKNDNQLLKNDNQQLKNKNMKLMNDTEMINRELQVQRQKWLKERTIIDTKYNELLALYNKEKSKQTNSPQYQLKIDQLIDENLKLSDNNELLIKKYNDLLSKKHNMKKLIIEMGNLDQSEKKLGGIDMIKVAFAKKDKIINDLMKK